MSAKNLAIRKSEPRTLLTFVEGLQNSDAELTLSRAHDHTTAIPTSNLQVAVAGEVSDLPITNKDNPLNVAKYGLEKLRAQGQLTAPEFDSMSEICEAVFETRDGKIDAQTAYATVRGVYEDLLVNEHPSPMAVAIAGVASGALASGLGPTPKARAPLNNQTPISE